MLAQRRRRLIAIISVIVALAIATALVLYALRQNVNLYYTPQQLKTTVITPDRLFRLGGMVVKGSVQHIPNSLQVSFVLTDYHAEVKVEYNGILPSLFREGQGIVAEGHLNQQGVFIASEVLAKHDANYHPPGMLTTSSDIPSNSVISNLQGISLAHGDPSQAWDDRESQDDNNTLAQQS